MTTFDLDFAADHFTLFGLPHVQALDQESLDNAFRAVQSQVHPDKHAHAAVRPTAGHAVGDAHQRGLPDV